MAVSKRLRYEILRRDSHTCRYCGLSAPEVKLTVDHVVPTALGGSDDPSNLVAACRDCNAGKSASSPDAALVADVDEKAVQWAQAMQQAIEQRAADLATERALTRWFDEAWLSWKRGGVAMPRDANWKNSVLRFFASGLDKEFISDAIATAMGKDRLPDEDRWRYFCGVCWGEIRTIQGLTVQIAGGEKPVPVTTASDDEFPLMEMASLILDEVLTAVGMTDARIRKIADSALWGGVPEAHRVWNETAPVPVDDEWELPRFEAATEHLSSYIARDMYEIGQILREGAGPDGS